MSNVFSKTNEINNHPKRNTFDVSFQNNFTGKMGVLYPVMCQEVLPGTSCKIKPTFALEFMPVAFPVQTRMRAYLHFFYVRNRNLWKDFPDFMAKTKDTLVRPYIDFKGDKAKFDEFFKIGGIADMMGVPNTISGSYGSKYSATVNVGSPMQPNITSPTLLSSLPDDAFLSAFYTAISEGPVTQVRGETFLEVQTSAVKLVQYPDSDLFYYSVDNTKLLACCCPLLLQDDFKNVKDQLVSATAAATELRLTWNKYNSVNYTRGMDLCFSINSGSSDGTTQFLIPANNTFHTVSFSYGPTTTSFKVRCYPESGQKLSLHFVFLNNADAKAFAGLFDPTYAKGGIALVNRKTPVASGEIDYLQNLSSFKSAAVNYGPENKFSSLSNNYGPMTWPSKSPVTIDNSPTYVHVFPQSGVTTLDIVAHASSDGSTVVIDQQSSPYYDSRLNTDGLMLNAEPFRAYESIYNAFYRDERNNPLIIDGEPEYNKWCRSQEGGADDLGYQLFRRNWEQDFLTTAVQSPQQGVAPLVGIVTTDGVNSLAFTDSETGQTFSAKVTRNDEGMVESLDVTPTDAPLNAPRSFINIAEQGISINDFRNINALQRWLETNMRKGYRLKDIIKGHYDVNVRFDELDMPEFLGGVAEDIRSSMVTQTSADTDGSPLGSYAGQLTCIGTSRRSIRKYFDEPGYLIGIFCIAPVPNYSQLLPPLFTKRNVLDMFFPEFGHIGYQPITYETVCPIQASLAGTPLSTVFGYQRPWWEYISKTDEVHGLMKTSLRDFLINRVFNDAPQLSEDFLLVDPAQTNNIFTVTSENEDVFMGQIYFDMSVKQPIPLVGVPRLE